MAVKRIDAEQNETPIKGEFIENPDEPTVQAEITIRVLTNGAVQVDGFEGERPLEAIEVENLTRSVYENLYEMRIAQKSLEMFKQRLG